MKSGSSRLPRRGQWISGFIAFLLLAGTAAAQQPANTDHHSAEQNSTPANLPAAEPMSHATVSASTGQASKTDDASKNITEEATVAKLGPGDLIEVSVYNVPELSSKVRVSNAGDIYLPLIDYVHVDGLTQEEAQTLIQKRLEDGGFVRSPHVTIFVDEAASQGVTILGEVGKPGIYPDTASHKLYEVISQAGGFSPPPRARLPCFVEIKQSRFTLICREILRTMSAEISTSCLVTRLPCRGHRLCMSSGTWDVRLDYWWTMDR